MNWNKIKTDSPKAYTALLRYKVIDSTYFTDRNLFDFFDENGIIIEVCYACDIKSISKDTRLSFYYDIQTYIVDDDIIFNSRKEAEEASFIKAFEILESKLK